GIRIATSWAEACAPASSTPKAATPTFTVVPGYVTSTQNVGIECSTAGAEIRYTTNGDDPTETSTLYTTPISVSTTTTIKAKAFKSGMDASSVASATYTFPTEVANIAALRAATHPGFYKLTGEAVLTLKSATRNAKYIQDATAAVLIDDNSGKITTAYNIGDGITGIIGTTALYNGMLQFTPSVDPGVATSTGKTITPALVEVADLVNYPAQLVKAKNVKFDATGNFKAGENYVLTGTTSVVVRTQYADLDYVANAIAIPTETKDIIGVVLIYNATTQLIPRSTADFVVATSVNNPSSKSGIYASEGKVVLTAEAGDVVEVFNAVGQRLVSVKAVSGENHIPVAAKGIVMVRTKGQSTKVVL
ncbi:MAG: chitobiase/beta-hexosaminidase C-terminal domain-containing protein, partial [Paludibacter sp.]